MKVNADPRSFARTRDALRTELTARIAQHRAVLAEAERQLAALDIPAERIIRLRPDTRTRDEGRIKVS